MTRSTAAPVRYLSPGGFDNLLGEAGNDTLTLATSDGGGTASGGEGNDTLFGSDKAICTLSYA
jgi:Ca2+-binding RTX toxin-like protein